MEDIHILYLYVCIYIEILKSVVLYIIIIEKILQCLALFNVYFIKCEKINLLIITPFQIFSWTLLWRERKRSWRRGSDRIHYIRFWIFRKSRIEQNKIFYRSGLFSYEPRHGSWREFRLRIGIKKGHRLFEKYILTRNYYFVRTFVT